MGNETVRKQTHSERLSEYIDAADRAAKSYAGQTQEIWWAALAATLREALADRQRIEILATAAMPMTDRTMSPEQRTVHSGPGHGECTQAECARVRRKRRDAERREQR